jgi:hypothetical protein
MAQARSFDPEKDGDNPEKIAQYLTSALASDDTALSGRLARVLHRLVACFEMAIR